MSWLFDNMTGGCMNKADLVDAIVRKTGASKAMTDSMIDALVDSVTTTLKKGENVTLVGFGTFSQGKRAARTGRNPQTGLEIKIPASRTARFAAGARLKAAVNGKG
jgi:DNA-binding protein HU-beta